MAINVKSIAKRLPLSLPVLAVLGLAIGFGITWRFIGQAANQAQSGRCQFNPAVISIGNTYRGTATDLPRHVVLQVNTTYGDGSRSSHVYGTTTDGSLTLGGYPATITGTTTVTITGRTRVLARTKTYASCHVQVEA